MRPTSTSQAFLRNQDVQYIAADKNRGAIGQTLRKNSGRSNPRSTAVNRDPNDVSNRLFS